MNERKLIRAGLTVAATALASMPALAQVSLEEAYRSALEKTETTAIERSRLNQLDARVDQARGRLLPNISLGANYLYQEGGGSTGVGRDGDQTSGRVILSQPLFQGQVIAGLGLARSQLLAQEKTLEAAHMGMFADVAGRYFEVQAAERDLRNLRATVKLTEDRIKELRSRTRIGRSRSGEVLTAESQLAVAQSQLEAGNAQLTVARDQFSFTTGLPRETEIADDQRAPADPKALPAYLEMVGERPDIKALQAQVDAARSGVNVARAGHLPSLSLTGNYYAYREGVGQTGDWDLGVGLTFPIFSGGTIQAQVREAKESETEAELELRQRRRLAETEVRSAYFNLTSALAQVKALEKALTATERNYREQTRDYRYSLVTNLEVFQAINMLQDTKRSLDRARVQASAAWAQLEAATAQIPK